MYMYIHIYIYIYIYHIIGTLWQLCKALNQGFRAEGFAAMGLQRVRS